MPRRAIDRIRDAIRTGQYDMTHHAVEEMAEDELGIFDIESAVLSGEVVRRERDDPRGIKYVLRGMATNSSVSIGIVGRFKETGTFIIITVYRII